MKHWVLTITDAELDFKFCWVLLYIIMLIELQAYKVMFFLAFLANIRIHI